MVYWGSETGRVDPSWPVKHTAITVKRSEAIHNPNQSHRRPHPTLQTGLYNLLAVSPLHPATTHKWPPYYSGPGTNANANTAPHAIPTLAYPRIAGWDTRASTAPSEPRFTHVNPSVLRLSECQNLTQISCNGQLPISAHRFVFRHKIISSTNGTAQRVNTTRHMNGQQVIKNEVLN